jgi:rhamnosyltransferase
MNIIAIIVTYNPDLIQVGRTINSIIQQVNHIIIIDNGNTAFPSVFLDKCTVINLKKNYGIAYAQNRGIEKAIDLNAKFIVLSDQDTIYPEEYVKKNLFVYNLLRSHNIAALVPVFYDKEKQIKSPIMLTKFSFTYNYSKAYIKTAQAISSGSFLITDSLKKIGIMNEKLFIDYVDFEWCWRATKLGYKIIAIPDIIISHSLGDRIVRIGKRKVFIRNKMRYYYIIRNGIYLVIYSNCLLFYERILLLRRVIIQIIAVLCIKINFNIIRIIIDAFYEGLSGRMRIYKYK